MGRVVGGAGGGVKRQWSGTPSWGERGACVAPIGVVGGFGEYAGWRSERSERSPLSWGAGGFSGRECGPGLVPKAEGSPGGAAPWCAVRVSTGGACVGVRTVASWGACERQRARGLGSGGAGPEGVVKRQRSGARSVPWRRALVSTGGGSCGRPCWHVIPLGGVSWWARGVGALPRGCRVEHGVG